MRLWQRRAGRARSNLFCIVPTVFIGSIERWGQHRRLVVLRWGFWEASLETWLEARFCGRCGCAGDCATGCSWAGYFGLEDGSDAYLCTRCTDWRVDDEEATTEFHFEVVEVKRDA